MVEEKPITYTLTLKLCQFRNLSYQQVSFTIKALADLGVILIEVSRD